MSLQAKSVATQALQADIGDLKVMSKVTDDNPISVGNNVILANPTIVAKWELKIQDGTLPTNFRYVTNGRTISAHIQRVSGTGSFVLGIATSVDDSIWALQASIGVASSGFQAFSDNDSTQQLPSNVTHYAIIAYGTTTDVIGEYKNLAMISPIVIPKGFTLERII